MSEPKPNLVCEHVYAIVRVDRVSFLGDSLDRDSLSNAITVKKLVWTEEDAKAEVERLNTINRDKGCFYFFQITRLERRQPGKEENSP
jgi:hypothetical protein